MKFILNDESVKNSHGFYLLNSGIKAVRFEKNPVMLFGHDRNRVIGRWDNLAQSGSQLTADPVFDAEDPESAAVQGKVERGYLRGASMGIYILAAEWRDLPNGESAIYVTEWELLEASIVSIPSNSESLKLMVYDHNQQVVDDRTISLHLDKIARPGMSESLVINNKNQNKKMKLSSEAMVALGISDGAEESAISSAIVSLAAANKRLETDLQAERAKLAELEKKKSEELVNLAIASGKIAADKKETFVKMAQSDFQSVKEMLDAIPAKESLSDKVREMSGVQSISDDRKSWTLLQWMQKDMPGLKRLQAEQPELYATIAKSK